MHPLHAYTIAYLTEVRTQRAQPNSTSELSYRNALTNFLTAAKDALGKTAVFTGEPKGSIYGRPDYEVKNGLKIIGYIEAEAYGADLRHLSGHAKEQNERFRDNLHNFLQTNHLDFRLYVDKAQVAAAALPEPPEHGRITVGDGTLDDLQRTLETFLNGATPAATTAKAVAEQLARRAKDLRYAATELLDKDHADLTSLWNLYRQSLFADIEKAKFADVYAQTFTYGLFLVWLNTDRRPFDLSTALRAIPKSVPPIRLLLTIGGSSYLPDEFLWIVNGICADLDEADKSAATRHGAGIADPLVSFYETFLKAYDPGLRERAGVYYTPDAVVDFIVRAVDDLLRDVFGKAEGLADKSVRLLDPATGTGTFLARAYNQVRQTMIEAGDEDLWPDRARDHVIPHFFGFERLPAAYTLAHVKLRQLLAETGVRLPEGERLPVYLADTMANKIPEQGSLPGADILSHEARDAARVRDQEDILVVLGNPPYFGKSDNPSKDAQGKPTFIGDLIKSYYFVDGAPLNEKNPKWLQNDYVKFIRFAQWRIERSGQGIVAFITDNSYLDNRTFRGMRQSLLSTFDNLYVFDLHGKVKEKERNLDGSEDKGVFDIEQGVSIALFVKSKLSPESVTKIKHADLYGTRDYKYHYLYNNDIKRIEWKYLSPNSPFYWFVPQEQAHRELFETWWKITEVFSSNNVGIVTGQDQNTIAITEPEADFLASKLPPISRLPVVQGALIRQLHYRPFDNRFITYGRGAVTRPRADIMRHLLDGQNSALVIGRSGSVIGDSEWNIVGVTNGLVDFNYYRRGGCQVHPLWDYPTESEAAIGMQRQPNISPKFIAELTAKIHSVPSPEDIFQYAYAVFHAPTYRSRYAEFLKTDFPRLPLPPDVDTFHALAALGERLVALHLLEAPELARHGIGYRGGGRSCGEEDARRRQVPAARSGRGAGGTGAAQRR